MKRRQTKKNSEAPSFNRRRVTIRRTKSLIFKFIIIKEIYIFLEILIYINSEKIPKFRDY
jgi:hypothetical protein